MQTRAVVNECVELEQIKPEAFIMALRSLVETRDAGTALSLFNRADQEQPALVSPVSFQILLTAIKFSPAHVEPGLRWYQNALDDSTRFPQLNTNVLTGIAAATLLLAAPVSAENLRKGVAIKNSLQAHGAKLDVGFYGTMILLATRHNDFTLATQLYEEFHASGLAPALDIEEKYLAATVRSKQFDVAKEVYQKIVADEKLGLTVKVIESMLRLCRHEGDANLCMKVLGLWAAKRGALTWEMCDDIVALLLTPQVLRVATSPGHIGGSAAESTIPGARAVPPEVLNKEVETDKRLLAQARIVHQIVKKVCQALNLFSSESERMQSAALDNASTLLRGCVVPASVLAPLAVLITHRMGGDALFVQLDSAIAQPKAVLRRQEHQLVVRTLARDLAVLGRWRALLSLRQRLQGYALASDPLQYTSPVRREIFIWSLLALLRQKHYSKADAYITQLHHEEKCTGVETLKAWLGAEDVAQVFPDELQYIAVKLAALDNSRM
jgi:hypothetical protein